MNSAKSKIALVTGAGSGIGQAASVALTEIGYHVILTGRQSSTLDITAGRINSCKGSSTVMAADISESAAVIELFRNVLAAFGRLDLLFNNAGVNAPPATIDELEFDDWRKVIDTNLTGVFLCTQQAFKIMRNQTPRGGRIINNGSISSMTPRPHSAAYTASKHAISGLTKATALDGRHFDIACGQIDIGNAETRIGSHVAIGALQADGSRLVEPMLDLTHVANAIKYMAGMPLDSNVLSLTVMATKMPFVGRG